MLLPIRVIRPYPPSPSHLCSSVHLPRIMGEPSIEINQKACVLSILFASNSLLTVFIVASFEDAISNALKNYFPRLEPTSNVRVEFYNKFQSEADGHDRDFLGKHNGALDNTLIFVSFFLPSLVLRLKRLFGSTGRFVVRGHIRVHPRCSDPAPTGLHPIDLRRPCDHRQFHRFGGCGQAQFRFPMDRPRSHPRPHPVYPFLKSGFFPPRCVRSHAGQTVAQPLRQSRYAWIPYRSQSGSTA